MSDDLVLVVDDERLARTALSRYLERQGFHVNSARNGKEAIAKVVSLQPTCVLMDISLGDEIDGIEASKIIQETSPQTAIAFVTGFASDYVYRRRIAESGVKVDGWFEKPLSLKGLADLVSLVKNSVKGRRKHQEKFRTILRERPDSDLQHSALLGISHELKGIFNLLALTLSNIQEDVRLLGGSKTTCEGISSALKEVDRGAELVRRFSTARVGEDYAQRTSVDLCKISREAIEQLAPVITARGVNCFFECDPSVNANCKAVGGQIFGYADRVLAAVKNILQNAIEASPRGGSVRVTVASTPGSSTVKISDEGEGVPPNLLAKIFEPHFSTKPGGTGFGLSIAKDIIERVHSGSIEVLLKSPGSCFSIILPALRS